jgi:hypothetical protein
MAAKVTVGGRTITRAEAVSALQQAMADDTFSRYAFPGKGALSALRVGSRRPRTPEQRVRFWERAHQLACDLDVSQASTAEKAAPQAKRIRDEAILHALTEAHQNTDYTIQLNGKRYALINKGYNKYTYAEIGGDTGCILRTWEKDKPRVPLSGLPHIMSRDGADLGPVIVNSRNLVGWNGLTLDESAEHDAQLELLRKGKTSQNQSKAPASIDTGAPKGIAPSARQGVEAKQSKVEGITSLPSVPRDVPVYVHQQAASLNEFQSAQKVAWQAALNNALQLPDLPEKDRRIIQNLLDVVTTYHASNIAAVLSRAAGLRSGESPFMRRLRDRAADIMESTTEQQLHALR